MERRRFALIHRLLVVSLVGYGILLATVRIRMSRNLSTPDVRTSFFLPLVVIGIAQFALFSWMARKRLRSAPGEPAARVRLYFLLRAASAEAIGLYGLLIGVRGEPILQAAALFALSLAAMISCYPTREAWQNALRLAQTQDP